MQPTTKKMNFWLIWFTISLLQSFNPTAYSQINIANNITIDDGLSYSRGTCAYKNNNRIIWLGTISGSSGWDRIESKYFYGSDGLPTHYKIQIAEKTRQL